MTSSSEAVPETWWLGFVDDAGKFALDKRKEFSEWVKKFSGNEVVLTVKKRPRRQGTQSMRYLRGVVVPDIARACGYTDVDEYQDVYNGLMWKFFRLPDGPMGEPRRLSLRKDSASQEVISNVIDTLITYGETSIPGCRVRRPEEVDLDTVWSPDYDDE